MNTFNTLHQRILQCRLCDEVLPHQPRPVLQVHPQARVLLIGQAPGRVVHQGGIPFDDASGKRLRQWLGMERSLFYNPQFLAIMPMGFCFPGTTKSGDLPPRPECAAAWHQALLDHLAQVRCTLLVGRFAQAAYWPQFSSLTASVAAWRLGAPQLWPLPHPSPRNRHWLKKNPYFEAALLPALRAHLAQLRSETPHL